ncbi:MAG: HlyD family type I secretion periplasmic adaptor subunit [Gammaproteobacteria bacterium]|nr:HlyD family type I secretion periplasmic adaptor subunit [Gammaproteobacteria bacterium]MBT3488857.1 HlyD family type I secretion periplasmic adaptor subunit [Gammaproteobacteria bacterium]MBT3719550.1 HlyD family type I secretion periplasmic adaptor subunit [Gammaproteobacteria bacterium]MBT3844511.1 HlyD family type I secretion periplasmic adaptor subunit [Gammaproteobacteria bacterium]MBT3891965.1 HlyD family type I secretion periplasmic adaptor subunit [Gammaproteobacteria bacterium]
MSDRSAAVLLRSPRGGRMIVWSIMAFMFVFMLWAGFAELDEVTVGEGKVIPSRQLQIVQNLEGGIISEVLIKEGDIVDEGQTLLRFDGIIMNASLQENRRKIQALKSKKARLQAEVGGKTLRFDETLIKAFPELIQQERELYESREKELQARIAGVDSQNKQIGQEIDGLRSKLNTLKKSIVISNKELEITRPLFLEGAVSKVELLGLERVVNDMQGEIEMVQLEIPRLGTQQEEMRTKRTEVELTFRNQAREELNQIIGELSALEEGAIALRDKVDRTAVLSPVRGVVKRVLASGIRSVVQPGSDLVEIVPLDDALLVEAKIRPADIAFIHPGQEVMVKFTAYDFSIYGGVTAKLEQISADTILDAVDGESYYLVKVRTDKTHLGTVKRPLEIIPGMVASVDILTGKKTVLEYLMKPVFKARQQALRER